jgi:CcmD family protein
MEKMLTLALVPLIVWAGFFFYTLSVDRKLARLEQSGEDEENL